MISLWLSVEDGLALQSFSPSRPLSLHLSSQKEALWENVRDEKRWGGGLVCFTPLQRRDCFFLLFVREEINSIHIIKFWQGETLSADIEKWQEWFKACLSSSSILSFRISPPLHNKIRLHYLAYLFSPSFFPAVFCPPFSVCLLWKGREWAASLTSWHHISCLVLRDTSLLFSRALW